MSFLLPLGACLLGPLERSKCCLGPTIQSHLSWSPCGSHCTVRPQSLDTWHQASLAPEPTVGPKVPAQD